MTKVEPAVAPLCTQISGIGGKQVNTIDAPMETVSDSTIKMHCYELYDYERGDTTVVKGIEAHNEGDGHPKPLEHISQGPDSKRTRICGFDDGKRIESYRSYEHLKRA